MDKAHDRNASLLDEFHLLHREENSTLLQAYYDLLKKCVALTQSTGHAEAKLLGSGFDMLASVMDIVDYGKDRFVIFPSVGYQTLYYVHRSSLVLETDDVDFKQNTPLLFFATPACVPGYVKLNLSARSHSAVLKEAKYDSAWPIAGSVVTRSDAKGIPKLFLSGKRFHELYFNHGAETENKANLILFPVPKAAFKMQSSEHSTPVAGEKDLAEQDLWHNAECDSINAVRVVPTFRISEWPRNASSWSKRKRQWPSAETVARVVEHSSVFITGETKRVTCDDGDDDLLWKMDFAEAESYILNCLSFHQRQALLHCLHVVKAETKEVYEYVKTSFLFTLETSPENIWGNGDSADLTSVVFQTLCSYLENGYIPHYFLENVNILNKDENDQQLLEHLKAFLPMNVVTAKMDCVLQNEMTAEHSKETFMQIITSSLRRRLNATFGKNMDMLLLQLYQTLHNVLSTTESITYHLNMLKYIKWFTEEELLPREIGQGVLAFVTMSLGLMYARMAREVKLSKEKQIYLSKARETLGDAQSGDQNICSLLHEALYLYMQREYRRVVEILSSVIEEYNSEDTREVLEDKALEHGLFYDVLVQTATTRTRQQDFMCSLLEREVLPKQISKNLRLAQNQFLGYTSCPVATYQSYFIVGYLLALAYIHEKLPKEAIEALHKVEELAMLDQEDMNEKRCVACLNLLADGHLSAGDKAQGKYLLGRSLKIMRNPRNPANWTLLGLKTERARMYLWGGIGFVLATTATAIVVNVFKSRP